MQYIDRELRNNQYPNCFRIAAYFDVSRKSIQRDIDFMRAQLKAPIDYDPQRKGYFYTENWVFDPATLLEQQESEALAATGKVLSQYDGTPYFDEVSRAIGKLMHLHSFSCTGANLFDIYSFDHPAAASFDPATFTLLEQAVRNRRKLTFTYRSSSRQAVTERTVRPYRLHYDQSSGTWYLLAYCEYRQTTRTFAVTRILHPKLTSDHFTLPSLFSVSNYMEEAFQQTLGPVLYDVAIRFTPYQSQWIREHRWHPSQKIDEHDDGSLTLNLTVSALDAVKRWVMRYGAHAEVLEPPELRDMIMQEVVAMGEVYGFEK
jgi:proteasome accessory factor B